MRKFWLSILIVVIAVVLTYASITLTNPIQVLTGATVTENNTNSGVMTIGVNFGTSGSQPSIQADFHNGTVSGSVINRSQLTPTVTLSINLSTGAWVATNGTSGQLNATQLNNINTTFRNLRNNLETFAVNNGIVQGTQVAW